MVDAPDENADVEEPETLSTEELQVALPDLEESLFIGGRERRTLTQSQKRQGCEYSVTSGAGQELNVSAAELKTLQEGDLTLREV
jgi:hypothetical protein